LEPIFDEERFPFTKLDDFDIIDAARKGYHIITVGVIGLTNFSAVCQFAFGIDQYEQDRLITLVNTKRETGTLFPKYNLTILPYRFRTTPFMTIGTYDYTNGKGFSDNEVATHIKDALKAETDYIKSNKLVFDFFHLGEDMLRYTIILLNYLAGDYKNYDWECYMYSVDNSEWR
jgi:hypothetical protein